MGGHKPRVPEGAQGDEPALRLRCVATPDIGPELGDARKGRPSIMVVQPRQAVWVSTTADVRWNAPPSDMISVEESVGEIQPWNDGNTASEIIRERFKKQLVPEAEKHLFGLFGHGFLVTPVAEEEPHGEARVGVGLKRKGKVLRTQRLSM